MDTLLSPAQLQKKKDQPFILGSDIHLVQNFVSYSENLPSNRAELEKTLDSSDDDAVGHYDVVWTTYKPLRDQAPKMQDSVDATHDLAGDALSDEEIGDLAEYYGRQPRRIPRAESRRAADTDLVAGGRRIALHGDEATNVGACTQCHGVLEATPTRVDDGLLPYPRLAGQHRGYLEAQLHAWRARVRGSVQDPDPKVAGAHQLEPEQIRAVAAYYATLSDSPLAYRGR